MTHQTRRACGARNLGTVTSPRWPRSVYGTGSEPDPRFSLANERTFLAWVRTSLALLAVAAAVDALPAHGVRVLASSSEEVVSVAGAGAGGINVGIAGAVDVYVLDITVTARIHGTDTAQATPTRVLACSLVLAAVASTSAASAATSASVEQQVEQLRAEVDRVGQELEQGALSYEQAEAELARLTQQHFAARADREALVEASDQARGALHGLALRQAEGGVPVAELCREHGMSNASFYKWRAKYGGMDASLISQMKAMEDENRRLKRMYADLSMQNDLLKEALGKK